MFESLRRSIGLQVARFRFRKSREKIISFTQSVSSARQALLIRPLEPEMQLHTNMIVLLLKQKFGDDNITVVTLDQHTDIARVLPGSSMIKVAATDQTLFFLPRRELIERIARRKYDLAIDLNLDLVVPSAYICKESKARVRVGFVSKRADVFYNFQIQRDPALNRQLIYDRLAKCLRMF